MTAADLTATTEYTEEATQTSAMEETAHAETETHATGPHISIKAEPIFTVAGFPITNSIILSLVVLGVFSAMLAKYNADAKKQNKSMFFYFITFVVRGVYELFKSAIGREKIWYFFPLVGSLFFFIILNNWAGLLPGVGTILYGKTPLLRASTADLNTTLALAILTMVMVQYYGVSHLGGSYFKKFLNFANPIAFFVGILEIISEFSRILSFAFRLFGNIFAGEVLLTVVMFLIPAFVSFPFLLLETIVGFIQAVVFSMLSAVLFKLAISSEH